MNRSIGETFAKKSSQEALFPIARRRTWIEFARHFLALSKYLIFQEKCRVCGCFIHPEIASMDLRRFRPPATCKLKEREISSECVCRICWLVIQATRPIRSRYELVLSGGEIRYLTVTSAVNFTGQVKSLIYRFKYDSDRLLAGDLAILSLPAWQMLAEEIDLASTYIVPVPLHSSRLRQRGFNQSEILAKQLRRFFKIKLLNKSLMRVKKTASQQALGKQQRLNNVTGAFRANDSLIGGKHILLIDDVLTSGATLLECAKTLQEAGAASVVAFTIAKVE